MSRVIRTVIALLLLGAGAMILPVGQAGAVEQGTISVHVTWPDGKPSETVQICFAVTSDAAGTDLLGSKCTDSEQNLAVFGPSDPALATGVTYYVWRADVVAKGPDAGAVTLLGDPVEAVIPDTSGNVDVTFAIHQPTSTTGSIEIHDSACPVGATSGTLFDQCHANGRQGVEYIVDGPVHQTGVTAGALGAVRFDNLPAGDYTIAQAVMSGDFASYQVYCSTSDGTEVPVDYRGDGRAAVALSVGSGQEIVCDWYNIPAPAPTEQPTQVPPTEPVVQPTLAPATEAVVQPTEAAVASGTPVVQLPVTGAGTGWGGQPWRDVAVVGLALLVTGAALILRRRDSN